MVSGWGKKVKKPTARKAAMGIMARSRGTPDPSLGSRSSTWLRRGSARPRTTMTSMMTMNGSASETPGCDTYRFISDWPMPITMAAASVRGNEVKPPNKAAAIAAMTSRVRLLTDNPASGTTRIPAVAASAPPRAQVVVARMSGDQPRAAAARWFSAVAVVARPTVVKRVTTNKVAEMATAMTTNHSWSTEMLAPKMWTMVRGRDDATWVWADW